MIYPSERAGGPSAQVKFGLGWLVVTPAALQALTSQDIQTALSRHQGGDWGDVDKDDSLENDLSLKKGLRLLSVYHGRNRTKFYIFTEGDRSITTVLLPSDY